MLKKNSIIIVFLMIVLPNIPLNATPLVVFEKKLVGNDKVSVQTALGVKYRFAGALHLDYKRLQSKDQKDLFRGFSAISVTNNRVIVLSDQGSFFIGTLKYNKSGEIEHLSIDYLRTMLSEAEDLCLLDDGRMLVVFEKPHTFRIYHALYNDELKTPTEIEMLNLKRSDMGIEAVTALKDGRVFTITEITTKPMELKKELLPLQVQKDRDGFAIDWFGHIRNDMIDWNDNCFIKLEGDFLVSSATTLPNGSLLLLERD